jgi:hypothetical protein
VQESLPITFEHAAAQERASGHSGSRPLTVNISLAKIQDSATTGLQPNRGIP